MRTGRPKGNKIGSVYYDKRKKGWIATYYLKDFENNKEIRKNKMFKTEDDAKGFLASIQYQKGNEIFIKNNGIPLNLLMRSILQRKLDMNLISENQYARVLKTINLLEKNSLLNKKIEDITSDDIQEYINLQNWYLIRMKMLMISL